MAISFNTGTTASANNAASVNFTIPAGVLVNDVMILVIEVFAETSTTPTISFSGGGGTWTAVPMNSGTNPELATAGSSIWSFGFAYYRVATSGDPGQVVTVSETGQAAATTWLSVAMAAYTGANTSSPIDVAAGNNAQGAVSGTAPSATTNTAGDWALYLAAAGTGSASFTGPGTSRENIDSSASVGAAVNDSNGSVGAAGSSIGGGTWSSTGTDWWSLFTIGLKAAGAAPPENPTVLPQQIPHPLWPELLEVADERSGWQQQGAASVAPQTWRLMDGAGGRPGIGSSGTQPPASATANAGNWVSGLAFYATQGGLWFCGYWWYVTASGSPPTVPQKFALWSNAPNNATGNTVVPGSVVTSGTLSAGWNYVPLPQPVQLSLYGIYVAATGVNGNYPLTAAQFSSGGPYQGGITSGPLSCLSDNNGTNPAPSGYTGNGCFTTAGSDPALIMPGTDAANAGDLMWLDVQVTNTAPSGYTGSYRLWPNAADSDYVTGPDAAANYVVGTEIILSQPCVVNAIWYYVSSGQGAVTNQWATSADIWRVRDGVRVATQPNPVWLKPFTGGVDVVSNGGRWVYCTLPGTVTLPAGDYYVTVYDGNASPNQWSAKRLGYWQQGGNNFTNDGTYQHTPPGTAGITNGPLYAPTTPLASPIQDYGNPASTEPGQSVFATGPPNQVPNRYVGQSSSGGTYTGPALFQNYWVDLEVTPAATFTPDAPDLPQRIPHPLYTRLLEVAAYRAASGPLPVPPAGSVPVLMAARTEVISRAAGRVIRR